MLEIETHTDPTVSTQMYIVKLASASPPSTVRYSCVLLYWVNLCFDFDDLILYDDLVNVVWASEPDVDCFTFASNSVWVSNSDSNVNYVEFNC